MADPFVDRFDVAKNHDIAYIARQCPNASADVTGFASFITYDRGISSIYIFDGNPDDPASTAFESAHSFALREVLCFPGFGCLIPPTLTDHCFS